MWSTDRDVEVLLAPFRVPRDVQLGRVQLAVLVHIVPLRDALLEPRLDGPPALHEACHRSGQHS
eukprot:77517-Prorocentrum_lima.AAC.1